MSVNLWSTTAATNATIDPSVNWRENQAPSTVNNSARAMMAAIAKWRDDESGNIETGGSSTAYTITSNQSLTPLVDGYSITARMHATNGASPTLNVDATGAKAIRTTTSTAVETGAMRVDGVYRFTYDSGDDCWYVHGFFSVTQPAASETVSGIIELATSAEVATGTDAVRAITPATLSANYLSQANNLSDVDSAATAFTNIKQAASDTDTGVLEIAIQSEMETGTSTTLAVVPGRQHFHPAHPKCWACITVSGGTPTLQTSHNITGITDDGTGEVIVTIATDFSSANWAPLSGSGNLFSTTIGKVAGSITLRGFNTSGGLEDPDDYSMAGFGDQA